jgi:hypothetical protein
MRRPSKLRRWFKWAGVLVCVALMVGWTVSEFGSVFIQRKNWNVDLAGGTLSMVHYVVTGPRPFTPARWGFNRDPSAVGHNDWLPFMHQFRTKQDVFTFTGRSSASPFGFPFSLCCCRQQSCFGVTGDILPAIVRNAATISPAILPASAPNAEGRYEATIKYTAMVEVGWFRLVPIQSYRH